MSKKKFIFVWSLGHYALWVSLLCVSFLYVAQNPIPSDKFGKPGIIVFIQNIINFPIFTIAFLIAKENIRYHQLSPVFFSLPRLPSSGPPIACYGDIACTKQDRHFGHFVNGKKKDNRWRLMVKTLRHFE